MSRLLAVGCLLAILAAQAPARGDTGASGRIALVVGRHSIVDAVSQDTLRDVYLRRQLLWPAGIRAIPVNLPAGNPIRERFSRIVLGRSTRELVSYWNARYFEGIMPPAVLPSAAAIRAYINAEPGAIAYLASEDVDETCRTLLWLDAGQP
ncbi:MAG TPA: hypothetical protein VGK30_14630 [Candidatus Binatia bacterium]